ncbi:hypothetical protein [Pseudomonas sp. CHM02]|uniref:hypothetical protein n=1 Tax=Pseudomonas sp. CHM02 TaxID=1463662 RepID=UPI0004704875|nr:hypothetical protein [Pseudomonas sp. CHM02]
MSEITRGAIGMPFEMAMESELSRRQFHSIAQALLVERDQLKAENEVFEEGMRSLASTLGAGGYNAETLTAIQLVGKVQWGVNHLADTSARIADDLRAENDALRKHQPSDEVIWCACGDGHSANSYGAGFMDANNGACANCDAAMGKGQQS